MGHAVPDCRGIDSSAVVALTDTVLVQPMVATRFANAVPGASVLIAAAAVPVSWFTWLMVAAGGFLMIRGFRMAVLVDNQAVQVRGYLRTRTIPRSAVVSLSRLPALRWSGRSGRLRWTPLIMFMTFRLR